MLWAVRSVARGTHEYVGFPRLWRGALQDAERMAAHVSSVCCHSANVNIWEQRAAARSALLSEERRAAEQERQRLEEEQRRDVAREAERAANLADRRVLRSEPRRPVLLTEVFAHLHNYQFILSAFPTPLLACQGPRGIVPSPVLQERAFVRAKATRTRIRRLF